jgi:hypothetical protein
MNKIVNVFLLLAVLASGACSAQQGTTCQPDCAADKRECGAVARHDAKREDSPLSIMNEELPHIVHGGDSRGRSMDVRAREHRDFENRKMARIRACDDKYMKCVRTCSSPAAGSDPGSVVLKRRDEL